MILERELLLVCLTFCIACASRDNPSQAIGLLHHSIKLSGKPDFPVQEVDWNFKSQDNSMKIAKFERLQPTFYKNQFQDRLQLLNNGTTLHIRDLRMEDSGMYSLQMILIDHKNHFADFFLTVFEPVLDPSIRIVEENRTDHWCNLTLHCSAPSNSSSLNYSWIYRHTDSVYKLSGDTLHISLNHTWGMEFQCIANNPADRKNVSKQAMCSADVAAKRLSSTLLLPLLLVPVIVFFVIWKIRKKGSPKGDDDDQVQISTVVLERCLSEEEEEHGGEQTQQEENMLYCETNFHNDKSTSQDFSWHERQNHVNPAPREFKTLYTSYQRK